MQPDPSLHPSQRPKQNTRTRTGLQAFTTLARQKLPASTYKRAQSFVGANLLASQLIGKIFMQWCPDLLRFSEPTDANVGLGIVICEAINDALNKAGSLPAQHESRGLRFDAIFLASLEVHLKNFKPSLTGFSRQWIIENTSQSVHASIEWIA
jgi:hypothetical protein